MKVQNSILTYAFTPGTSESEKKHALLCESTGVAKFTQRHFRVKLNDSSMAFCFFLYYKFASITFEWQWNMLVLLIADLEVL